MLFFIADRMKFQWAIGDRFQEAFGLFGLVDIKGLNS